MLLLSTFRLNNQLLSSQRILLTLAWLVASNTVVFPSKAQELPPVRWIVPNVKATIEAGKTTKIEVQFATLKQLNSVSFQLNNTILARYIQIKPQSISRLAKGASQTITLTFASPSGVAPPSAAVEGAIYVRASGANMQLALPISLKVVSDSLGGPDANGNGIRDDIDDYIASTFLDPPSRAAAEQFARVVQRSLLDATSKEASIVHGTELDRAVECMGSIRGEAGDDAVMEIEARTINTMTRVQAYSSFSDHLNGSYFRGTVGTNQQSACK